ncbi:MAG: alpha-N-arabinofuranosidase, partial [Anaerolineae bacterium]|nr:alpha-N-arabinofuranosidase [Anaerolineae bacterium]
IWLIVDEWGAWYPVEPGTNPAFLYQQNSMRDAIVAALTLHIFQKYSDRVQMANLAQTVNVIQALFLTEDEKMILTPTYHVFDMFKGHQDATRLALEIETDSTTVDGYELPFVSASASRTTSGEVLLTLCNLHPNEARSVTVNVADMDVTNVDGTILVGDAIQAHNTFEEPDRVTPQAFEGTTLVDGTLTIALPAASVVALTLQ